MIKPNMSVQAKFTNTERKRQNYIVHQRSLMNFYIATYHIKMDKTSRTNGRSYLVIYRSAVVLLNVVVSGLPVVLLVSLLLSRGVSYQIQIKSPICF